MATLEELKIPDIKKILRSCDIDPTDILAAKTRVELLELARHNGIVDVPDEWTIAKIKQQRQEARWRRMEAELDVAAAAAPAAGWRHGSLDWTMNHSVC